jgi:excisionase family DNA binding protein
MHPHEYNLTRAAYSVNELLEILPLGRTSLYAAIKAGTLKATKLGKKTLFLAPDVAAFLAALPTMPQRAA